MLMALPQRAWLEARCAGQWYAAPGRCPKLVAVCEMGLRLLSACSTQTHEGAPNATGESHQGVKRTDQRVNAWWLEHMHAFTADTSDAQGIQSSAAESRKCSQ